MRPRLTGPGGATLLGGLVFGGLIFLLLPASVITLDDDFGYLRSVVETVRRGRPWTDDWLEPWSASLSVLAGLVFQITGSFNLAVHGTLVAAGVVSLVGAAGLFSSRGLSTGRAVSFAALLLTFPTLLWKSVEFTGMALYLPCLLFALGTAERRRWGWFLLAWSVALATRQSALTWGALPAVELARLWGTRGAIRGTARSREPLWLVAVGMTGLGVFLGMTWGMNKTHAQRLLTDHAFEHIQWSEVFRGNAIGVLVFLGMAGIGGLALRWRADSLPVRWRPLLPRMAMAAVFVLLAAFVDLRGIVSVEHPLFSAPVGWGYTKFLLALAALGWAAGGFTLRPAHTLAAAASLALLSLRGTIWDYYLIDVAVFGFFAPTAGMAEAPARTTARLPPWAWVMPTLVCGFHLVFVGEMKVFLDRARALCLLGEGALRTSRMEAAELNFAPFGFVGWHLHPWFVSHEGRTDPDIAGFTNYLRPGAVEVGQGYSEELKVLPRFQHDPPADRSNLVATGRYRMLWFYHAEYYLLRFKTAAGAPAVLALPRDYQAPAFPLNDAEWRAFINRAEAP